MITGVVVSALAFIALVLVARYVRRNKARSAALRRRIAEIRTEQAERYGYDCIGMFVGDLPEVEEESAEEKTVIMAPIPREPDQTLEMHDVEAEMVRPYYLQHIRNESW